MANELGVAEEGRRAMVVGVEESWNPLALRYLDRHSDARTQRLLLQEQEAGVNQLEELGEVVELYTCVSLVCSGRLL